MPNLYEYVEKFFSELEIYEDEENEKNYKMKILHSINKFLQEKNEETAYNVYRSFFEAYWIGIQDEENPFLELTEKMKEFEEHGGRLLEKHRDHYLHSVFVFLLGISIYIQNEPFRSIFNGYALDRSVYSNSYSTNHEEFFYRWGIASLFHDIAYPLEISIEQAKEYAGFVCSYPNENGENLGLKVSLLTSTEFLQLPIIKPKKKWEEEFNQKYGSCSRFCDDSITLISVAISESFGIDMDSIKTFLEDYVKGMMEGRQIDHGFCSSIILLRWYHHLIKTTEWDPSYFYFPILDSASAIFMHNFYKYGLMNEPFNLGPMNVNQHPIAYLLILCDELQEWNRKGYGKISIKQNNPINFDININNTFIEINYDFEGKKIDKNITNKSKSISKVITIEDLFIKGLSIEWGD